MNPFEILINIGQLDRDINVFNSKKYNENIICYAISAEEVIVFTRTMIEHMKNIAGQNGRFNKLIKKKLVGFDGLMYDKDSRRIKDVIKKIKGDDFVNANNAFFDIRRLKEALRFIQYEKGDELCDRMTNMIKMELISRLLPPLPIEQKPIEEQKSSSIIVSEEQEHVNKKKRLLELPTIEEYAELIELIKKKKEENNIE
jgi:hypothetical protein